MEHESFIIPQISAIVVVENMKFFFFIQKPIFNLLFFKTHRKYPQNLVKPILGLQEHKKTAPNPIINPK